MLYIQRQPHHPSSPEPFPPSTIGDYLSRVAWRSKTHGEVPDESIRAYHQQPGPWGGVRMRIYTGLCMSSKHSERMQAMIQTRRV